MSMSLKRFRADGDDDEENRASQPPYTLDGPTMPTPSVVHSDGDFDLQAGPMWSVRVASLSPAHLEAHLKDLTCEPNKGKKHVAGKVPKTFRIGHVGTGRLFMPPWYAKMAFPKTVPVSSTLTRGVGMRDEVVFSGALRAHPPQQQAALRYQEWLKEQLASQSPTSCIVSLPCGYGKTVWFLAVAAALKRVTLVLAHTIALVDQWIEEARRFLTGVRVGYVKDGAMRVDGVDIVVASVQSLRSHINSDAPYVRTLFERVGTVCMDEGHHAVAGTFWEVMSQCPALYRFVLTATPRRKDGLLPQLQWIAGPVIFRAFRRVDEVHVVCVEYVTTEVVEIYRRRMLDNAGMVTALCENELRTAMAVELACHLVTTQQRRIVIVTPRVEHIHVLADAITAKLAAAGILPRQVDMFRYDKYTVRKTKRKDETAAEAEARYLTAKYAWEDSGPHGKMERVTAPLVGRVLAGMETFERETQYEGLVVVASPNIMEEGVSYKQWDTLLDLNNSSDAEQVVGRILRECPTKKVPLIIDFWVAVSLFQGLFWKRFGYYRDEDFSRQCVKASNVREVLSVIDWSKFNINVAAK